ncbi:unnamed protein product [Rotaria sp. Silwood1]|nr:unnamed protein product [Rotaria sp. Silwood1]
MMNEFERHIRGIQEILEQIDLDYSRMIFYQNKVRRPMTYPQVLREKFDEFAYLMVEKLKNYEEQCRSYHENSINDIKKFSLTKD